MSEESRKKKHFQTCDNKGFHLTFDNGLTLSTQFGPGNYGDNYDKPFHFSGTDIPRSYDADQVEVAIIGSDGAWVTKQYRDDGDDVLPRVEFDEWLKIVDWCKNWTKK